MAMRSRSPPRRRRPDVRTEMVMSNSIANASSSRDAQLDLFRGLANWAIFLDHLSWMTMRNHGFSDAADLFVFISGYTAALVFLRVMREKGYAAGGR